MSEWKSSFDDQETWIFNTAYYLFGKKGPNVASHSAWWSRLDELAKCVGLSTGQAVRLIFADAIVNIEGTDLWYWMRFLGQTAPSEQQMVKMLVPNIAAAWRGDRKTWTLEEAQDAYNCPDGAWGPDSYAEPPKPGQPTPGVFVWRNSWGEAAQDTGKKLQAQTLADSAAAEKLVDVPDLDFETLLHRGVSTNVACFLRRLEGRDSPVDKPASNMAISRSFGVLLEYSGADLQFLATRPLTAPDGVGALPGTCVTMLGGPKGISAGVVDAVRLTFKDHGIPLLEIALGEEQQMAHVCLGYLRVEDQKGRYKAALTDLFRLGAAGYAEFMEAVDGALAELHSSAFSQKRKRVV